MYIFSALGTLNRCRLKIDTRSVYLLLRKSNWWKKKRKNSERNVYFSWKCVSLCRWYLRKGPNHLHLCGKMFGQYPSYIWKKNMVWLKWQKPLHTLNAKSRRDNKKPRHIEWNNKKKEWEEKRKRRQIKHKMKFDKNTSVVQTRSFPFDFSCIYFVCIQ